MDIKAKVDELMTKVKGDDAFLAKFKEDPVKAVEGLVGVDLPDEQMKGIVDGLKGKLNLDKDGDGKLDIIENIGEKVGDLGDKIGGLFKKD